MTDTGTGLYLFVKMIFTLVFLLGLLGLALWAVKYYAKRRSPLGAKFINPVRVLNTSFIGQKKAITVVEVAGEILVLGVTATQITFLTKIDDPETIIELKKLDGMKQRQFLSFFTNV